MLIRVKYNYIHPNTISLCVYKEWCITEHVDETTISASAIKGRLSFPTTLIIDICPWTYHDALSNWIDFKSMSLAFV